MVSLGAVKLASFSLSPHNITKVVGTSRHLDNGVGIYIDVSEMDTGIERREAPVDWTAAPMGKGNKYVLVVGSSPRLGTVSIQSPSLGPPFLSTQSVVNFSSQPSQLLDD